MEKSWLIIIWITGFIQILIQWLSASGVDLNNELGQKGN
jgi:hypothetical protein